MAVNPGDRVAGMALSAFVCVPMALKAAIKLKVFEIISRAGAGASLSASDIAAEIPTANPNAAAALERILRMLAANTLLTVSYKDGLAAYGLTNWATSLAPRDEGGPSCAAAFLLMANEATGAGLHRLHDAVLEEGAVPFDRANGMNAFAFAEKEKGFGKVFHNAMSNLSAMVMEEALAVYDGFEKVKEIVDVGGGVGTSLAMIVSKYSHIRAINFDLPYVVANAIPHPGVTHVGGNMFEAIPRAADTIFMKNILHSWNDDKSVKLLRKCLEALPPEGGKVIAIEFVVPPVVGHDIASLNAITHDILMLNGCGAEGKERTLKEFTRLSLAAGFAEMKNIPVAHGIHLLEFQA